MDGNITYSQTLLHINNVVHRLESSEPEPGEPTLKNLKA